jgi:hypothetical protein
MQLRLREQSPLMCQTHTADRRPDSLQHRLSSWFLPYRSRADELLKRLRTRYIAWEKAPARFRRHRQMQAFADVEGIALVGNKLPSNSS